MIFLIFRFTFILFTDCGIPGEITNGTSELDVPGKTTYPSTATISCDLGFEASADSISCQANGTWEDASCEIKGAKYYQNHLIYFNFTINHNQILVSFFKTLTK